MKLKPNMFKTKTIKSDELLTKIGDATNNKSALDEDSYFGQ